MQDSSSFLNFFSKDHMHYGWYQSWTSWQGTISWTISPTKCKSYSYNFDQVSYGDCKHNKRILESLLFFRSNQRIKDELCLWSCSTFHRENNWQVLRGKCLSCSRKGPLFILSSERMNLTQRTWQVIMRFLVKIIISLNINPLNWDCFVWDSYWFS